MTKTFVLKADIEFEAEDITDAFRRLTAYFKSRISLSDGPTSKLISKGSFEISPKVVTK